MVSIECHLLCLTWCLTACSFYSGESNKETTNYIKKGEGAVSQQAEHLHQAVRLVSFFLCLPLSYVQ